MRWYSCFPKVAIAAANASRVPERSYELLVGFEKFGMSFAHGEVSLGQFAILKGLLRESQ
jgi:hypothetical protein